MGVAVFLGLLLVFLLLVVMGLWMAFNSLRHLSTVVWHKLRQNGADGHTH
jgi:hypothetical protein